MTIVHRVLQRHLHRFAAAPPKELTTAVNKAVGKMEEVIKSKMGKPFEKITALEYDDGLLSVSFWGPKKKGTKSPVPEEPFGRFVVQFQVSHDDSVVVTASYIPWAKKGKSYGLLLSDPIEEQEGSVELAKADDTAVTLLGRLAEKAKRLIER